jgi:hypothetical protein
LYIEEKQDRLRRCAPSAGDHFSQVLTKTGKLKGVTGRTSNARSKIARVEAPTLMEMGFDRRIVDYICKRLRDGIADSTITEELMRTDDPLFLPINADFGVAISYLAYAKKVCPKGEHHGSTH